MTSIKPKEEEISFKGEDISPEKDGGKGFLMNIIFD
jgi:hypothetical protein